MDDKENCIELTQENVQRLIDNGTINLVSEAEWARFVLRALLNYHERVMMNNNYPELECWKKGLQFAISCVEEKTPMGAFDTPTIDNDIVAVMKALEEY